MEILTSFNASTHKIIDLLNQTTNDTLVFKMDDAKWSIADIIEHINISDKSGYVAMLRTAPAPSKDILEETQERLRKLAADTNFIAIAPASAAPLGKIKSTEEALALFQPTRNRIADFVSKNELESLAIGFEHPRLGFLTRHQWLLFLAWHSNHHAKQIETILRY